MSKITKEALLSTLPPVLAADEKMVAIAESVAGVLETRVTEIDSIAFYRSIDTLPEALLDILAKDFAVEWWVGNASLDEKRKTLKEAWGVHSRLGTKGAIENALSAIYENSQVKEWNEYGAKPYHFKVCIDASYQSVDPDKYAQVISKVKYYKNLRSLFDGVEFIEMSATASEYAYAGFVGYSITDGCRAL